MIRVDRDRGDSGKIRQDLEKLRLQRMPKLHKLINDGLAGTEEFRKLLDGYQIAKPHLWTNQHEKCCYCEKAEEKSFNDVEHYRPKSIYWWLAFTWTNLLFACKQCNRSEKNAQFPLHSGVRLKPGEPADGHEVPLLLDPSNARMNPVEHIEFSWKPYLGSGPNRWVADARNGSLYGTNSIGAYGLNRSDLFELRKKHVTRVVKPITDRLNRLLDEQNFREAQYSFEDAQKCLEPAGYYVALSYDAFRHYVPNERLKEIRCSWPEPSQVGIARAPRPLVRPVKSPKPTR